MTIREEKVREALRAIGERRKGIRRDEIRLAQETKKALQRAQGLLPVEEAAKLAGVGRATAYQTYLGESDGKADGRGKGKGGPGSGRGKGSSGKG